MFDEQITSSLASHQRLDQPSVSLGIRHKRGLQFPEFPSSTATRGDIWELRSTPLKVAQDKGLASNVACFKPTSGQLGGTELLKKPEEKLPNPSWIPLQEREQKPR